MYYTGLIMYKNNNPFNIRYNPKNNWLGQIGNKNGFCVFADVDFGLRCGILLLRNYIRSGLTDVDSIISKYAPKNENNTQSYIFCVKEWMSKAGYQPFDIIPFDENFYHLCQCIIRYECQTYFSINQLKRISRLYGLK